MTRNYKRKELLINHKFGMLLVLEETESREVFDKRIGYVRRIRRVKCQCDCGMILDRDYNTLPKQVKRGGVPNCGCRNKQPKEILNDITPVPNCKNFTKKEKRNLVEHLFRKGYTNKEIILKTGYSCGLVSSVRQNIGLSTFTTKSEIPIGKKINRITIKEQAPSINRFRMVVGECECGVVKLYRVSHLLRGDIKSCGCYAREVAKEIMINKLLPNNFVHGDGKVDSPHRYLFEIWMGMKQRCYNPNNKRYKTYGERGITIYEPWINDYPSFKSWILENLGERPKGKTDKRSDGFSLDRIDVNVGYQPGNLRWADFTTQANNKTIRTKNHKTRNDLIGEGYGHEIYRSIKLKKLYESYYGKVRRGNHIHHINWDARDNSPENLIEVTSLQHGWLHKTKNYGLRTCTRDEIIEKLNKVNWENYYIESIKFRSSSQIKTLKRPNPHRRGIN